MADWNTQDGDGTMPIYKSLVRKVSIPAQSKIKQKDYLPKGAYPVIDQGQELIGGYTDDPSKLVRCRLPVIVFGDHTKAVKSITFPFAAGADGIKVLEVTEGIDPRFLFYATKYLTYKIENKGYARHYQFVEQKDIYIPDLPEQQRIVGRIEELFSQLDDAEATLQKTKAQLALYRQAVLKEAFESVPVRISLGNISESRLGKMLDKEKNKGTPRPYLRNVNVRWFEFDMEDLLEMQIEENEVDKYSLRKGDLVICEGGEPGRCAVWEKDDTIFYQKALHRVRFTDGSNPRFYMYYLWYAAQTGQLKPLFTGTGIKHLTGQSLVKVLVPKAERPVQNSLLNEIESRLSVCENIELIVDTTLQQVRAMRQSILKNSFKGDL